jgi:hypothetical protein
MGKQKRKGVKVVRICFTPVSNPFLLFTFQSKHARFRIQWLKMCEKSTL